MISAKTHIHPGSFKIFNAYAKNPPHALLITGPSGIGKFAVAKFWAEQTSVHSNFEVIEPEGSTISIEAIRGLYRSSRSKQVGQQMIIIKNAQAMSDAAENALLKLLEEPRAGITFILTATHKHALLPTILSRVQHIELRRLDQKTMQNLVITANPNLTPTDMAQLLFIAAGRPEVAIKLATSSDQLQKKRLLMQQAKELISAKPYQRICDINKLASNRLDCIEILDAMLLMTQVQIKSASPSLVDHLLGRANIIENTLAKISCNGNIKAQLLALFSLL
ncbi:MAG: AAA family ATPase [Candidatus Woesebacteria bacterium]|jgi:DNA polymerase III delta prime subunit